MFVVNITVLSILGGKKHLSETSEICTCTVHGQKIPVPHASATTNLEGDTSLDIGTNRGAISRELRDLEARVLLSTPFARSGIVRGEFCTIRDSARGGGRKNRLLYICFSEALDSMGVSWDIINDDGVSIGLNQYLYSHLRIIYSQYFLKWPQCTETR